MWLGFDGFGKKDSKGEIPKVRNKSIYSSFSLIFIALKT